MDESIQQRATRGALVLFGRTVVLNIVQFGVSIVLARVLSPAQFGLYAVVAFVVAFFATFSDVGLGAALIQQRDEPHERELRSVFSLQLVLVVLVTIIGFIVAEWVSRVYHFQTGEEWLIRIMLLSLPINALRSIPSALLERDLKYGRLGTVEMVEGIVFYLSTLVLVLLGMGVWSLAWAAIFRAVCGVAVAYALCPWVPGVAFDRLSIEKLLHFGVPYQAQGILSFVKDAMNPTILALFLGTGALGYVNWAYSLAATPMIVTQVLGRVTFPAFARAQHDRQLLRRLVERSIRLSAIAFCPLSCILMGAGPEIIHFVYTDKWHPALISFYLFSISFWTAPLVGSTFFSLFFACGKARLSLYFTIMYGVLDWCIGLPMLAAFGFNGVAIRSVIVAYGTLPILIFVVRREMPVEVLANVWRPMVVSVGVGLTEALSLALLPQSLLGLLIVLTASSLAYGVCISIWERATLSSVLRLVLPRQVLAAFASHISASEAV